MKLTVKDLFDIPICREFKLIAVSGGLSRPVNGTEILDFEFIKGASMSRNEIFIGKTLVLTSFLFAKDDPELITDAIRRLYDLNISCMAYKPVLVKSLPREALDFADSHDFPILEFGGDEFFEDIIMAIRHELEEGEDIAALEKEFAGILAEELSSREESRLCKKINSDFKRFIRAVYIKDSCHDSDESLIALVRKMSSMEKLRKKAALCKFRDGYFVFLSQDIPDSERFRALLTDVFVTLQIDKDCVRCGVSSMLPAGEHFGKTVREAFWACNIAVMEDVPVRLYSDTGIYRLLVPEIQSRNLQDYMEEYLKPLSGDKHELLDTACTYILAHGDLEETSRRLFCHKNTVRYRLSKLHELLDPGVNDKEFHENLSMAVRIYMLLKYK